MGAGVKVGLPNVAAEGEMIRRTDDYSKYCLTSQTHG